jgi:hypothetical protein
LHFAHTSAEWRKKQAQKPWLLKIHAPRNCKPQTPNPLSWKYELLLLPDRWSRASSWSCIYLTHLLKGKKNNHTSSGSWKSMPQGFGNPKPIFLEVRPPPPSLSLEAGRGLRRTPSCRFGVGVRERSRGYCTAWQGAGDGQGLGFRVFGAWAATTYNRR